MEQEHSPRRLLADTLLADRGGLDAFVQTRREAGLSWRRITWELYEATDHKVEISYETLRSWFPETPEVAAS